MKKYFLIILLVFIGETLTAQDQIGVKGELKFKSGIFGKRNFYEGNERIKDKTLVKNKMLINEEAYLAYNKGMEQTSVGTFLIAIAPVVSLLTTRFADNPGNSFATLGLTFVSGVVVYSLGAKKLKSSAKIYNESLKISSTFSPSLNYSLVPLSSYKSDKIEGVGLSLKLNF